MENIPDLWPEQVIAEKSVTPKAVLQRQAQILGEKTGGVVLGEVTTTIIGRDFVHTLWLATPKLDDYKHMVVRVRHTMSSVYPAKLSLTEKEDKSRECTNLDQLCEMLSRILHHEHTVGAIRALYVNSD